MKVWGSAAVGFFVGSFPGLCFLLWATGVNPFFLDNAMSFVLWALVIPALPLMGIMALLARGQRTVPRVGKRLGLGLGGIWLLVVLFAAIRPRPSIENTDMLVVGWDGATFQQMDPLQEAGRLPVMEELRDSGTSAVLMSMEPMFSPLLWTSMATGKPPEEHGIQGFSVHASDVQAPRFWDLVEQAGGGIGVYKWLVTYPPRAVKGFIVPAWLAPAPVTWPAALSVVKEIELSNVWSAAAKRRDAQAAACSSMAFGRAFGGARFAGRLLGKSVSFGNILSHGIGEWRWRT